MGSVKTTLFLTGKLALAGAVICAIAWVFAVYQPDGSIRESEADILDLNMLELSDTARFARGLDQLGHDEPQTFDINGNVVNFSVNYSSKRPEQLVKEYQEEFVYQGINKRVWDPSEKLAENRQMQYEAMTGSVVPLSVSKDQALLGGVTPTAEVNSPDDLRRLIDRIAPGEQGLFTGHRTIRMLWDPLELRSTITATWADKRFNYGKMIGADGVDASTRSASRSLSVDTAVPACPGCARINRVRDLNPSRNYSSNVFSGTRNQDDLLDFYRKAMPRRGWTETESSLTFNAAKPYIDFEGSEASMVQFARGNRFLTVIGFPGADGRTVVHTTVTN